MYLPMHFNSQMPVPQGGVMGKDGEKRGGRGREKLVIKIGRGRRGKENNFYKAP